ncbi:MAG: hypothetical protein AB1Z65_03015 [Candidatus Sulfomarinibacteraceae bacterium]
MLRSGVGAGAWVLALILVLGSVVSIYYYLRVLVVMYMNETPEWQCGDPEPPVPMTVAAVLIALLAVILWLGVWPGPVLELVRTAVGAL